MASNGDCTSLKQRIVAIAFLEFFARLIFLIVLINAMPPTEPNQEYLEHFKENDPDASWEDVQDFKSELTLLLCMLGLEMFLPPLILVSGAIAENGTLLSMWFGHKILEILHVFMVLMYVFIMIGNFSKLTIKVIFVFYNAINVCYLSTVYKHIKEVKRRILLQVNILRTHVNEGDSKREDNSGKDEFGRPSGLPYPIQN